MEEEINLTVPVEARGRGSGSGRMTKVPSGRTQWRRGGGNSRGQTTFRCWTRTPQKPGTCGPHLPWGLRAPLCPPRPPPPNQFACSRSPPAPRVARWERIKWTAQSMDTVSVLFYLFSSHRATFLFFFFLASAIPPSSSYTLSHYIFFNFFLAKNSIISVWLFIINVWWNILLLLSPSENKLFKWN